MENKEHELNDGYISYNGLNRPPLIMGIPIMALILILSLTFFIAFPLFFYVNTFNEFGISSPIHRQTSVLI